MEGSGDNSGKDSESFNLNLDTNKFALEITAAPADGAYVLTAEYDRQRYNRRDIGILLDTIGTIASGMTEKVILGEVQNVDDESQRELLSLGKGEELVYDRSETLVDLIRRQAAATPDATAVVFEEKRLSYRELDEVTDRLAVHIHSQFGTGRGYNVGIMIDRSELMVIYPLAIMKAGGAYMPLDFKFPAERLEFMCQDAGVRLILSEGNRVQEAMPHFDGAVFTGDMLPALPCVSESDLSSLEKTVPDDTYIILYTSGSTGKPKGVTLTQGNIMNFCHWCVKDFDLGVDDRVAAYANFGFDVHQADLWPALSCGAGIYVIPSEMRMDLPALNEYIERERLTYSNMTTQIGHLYATMYPDSCLRLLSLAGEKLPPVRKPGYRLYNNYGPTEATIYATSLSIDSDYNNDSIGRPLSNYSVYIVDRNLNLVPRGVPGELIIAGAGVAGGYLKRPELTAEKFINYGGERAYRTGDLARWRADGGIDYLGRIDNQVKLRGLRIEFGEIESKVISFPGIRQTVVDVKEIGGVKNICCYYTTEPEMTVDEGKLQEYLKSSLADYMIPAAYVLLEKMPYNANGKVDRKALPVPQVQSTVEYVAPSTEAEEKLCAAIDRLLNTGSPISVLDSFNALGGDSIKAIRLVSALRQEGITLQVSQIMKLKVIRDIAAAAQLAGNDVEINQAPVTGEIKDSAVVKYFFDLGLPRPDHFNQAILFKAAEPVDMEIMRKTMDALQEHHDMLRAKVNENHLLIKE